MRPNIADAELTVNLTADTERLQRGLEKAQYQLLWFFGYTRPPLKWDAPPRPTWPRPPRVPEEDSTP